MNVPKCLRIVWNHVWSQKGCTGNFGVNSKIVTFDKNGKGLAHIIFAKKWIFSIFSVFPHLDMSQQCPENCYWSPVWSWKGTLSVKYGGNAKIHHFFDKNGKWLAHFFCQKLNIFNLLRIYLHLECPNSASQTCYGSPVWSMKWEVKCQILG